MIRQYVFSVNISPEQCQRYYQGQTRYILAVTDDGTKVQLQFKHFQPYISHLGIRGRFRLTLNSTHFVSLEKMN